MAPPTKTKHWSYNELSDNAQLQLSLLSQRQILGTGKYRGISPLCSGE